MGFRVFGLRGSTSEEEAEGLVSPVIARNGGSVYDGLCRFVAWIEDGVQSILDKPFTWIARLDQSGSLTSVLQKIRKIVLRVVEWDEDIWSIIKRLSPWIYQSQVDPIDEKPTISSDPSQWIDIWDMVDAWQVFWSDYAKSRWFDRTSPRNTLTTRKADIFKILKGLLGDYQITFTEADEVQNLSIFTWAPSEDSIVGVQYVESDDGNITLSVHRSSEGEGNISWVYTHLPHIIIPSSMDLAEVRWFLEKQLFPAKEDKEEELDFEPRDLQWIREKRVRATCYALRSILGEWVSIDRVEKFWPRWKFRVESSTNRILALHYKVDADGSITLAVYRESEIEGVDTFLEYINVPVSMHTSRMREFLEDWLHQDLNYLSWRQASQLVFDWTLMGRFMGTHREVLLWTSGAILNWDRVEKSDQILSWWFPSPDEIRDSETPIDIGENGFGWLNHTSNGHLNWHIKLEELSPRNVLEQDDWIRETSHFARLITGPLRTIELDTSRDIWDLSDSQFIVEEAEVIMDLTGKSNIIGKGHVIRPSHTKIGSFLIWRWNTASPKVPSRFEWEFELSGEPLEFLRETVEIFYPHQSCQFIGIDSPGVYAHNFAGWTKYLYRKWIKGVVCFATTGITSNVPGVTLIDADKFMDWKEWFVDVIRWLEEIFSASHRTRLNGSVNRKWNWNWGVSFKGGHLADRAEWAEVQYWDN